MRKNQYKQLKRKLLNMQERIFAITDSVIFNCEINNTIVLLDKYKDEI